MSVSRDRDAITGEFESYETSKQRAKRDGVRVMDVASTKMGDNVSHS